MEWISAKQQKPKQGERVLLTIEGEGCPVVGYWGCCGFEACTVNVEVEYCSRCYGRCVESGFHSDDVTHWMPLPSGP